MIRNNVCEIFNHNDEEIKKLTIDLAKEMIIPNYSKVIINGGLIELFSTDASEESSIENSFKNFIHLLEISTKEVAYLFETLQENQLQYQQIESLIPVLQINLSTINTLILLLDYSKPSAALNKYSET